MPSYHEITCKKCSLPCRVILKDKIPCRDTESSTCPRCGTLNSHSTSYNIDEFEWASWSDGEAHPQGQDR